MIGLLIVSVAVILGTLYVWYVHKTIDKNFSDNETDWADEQEQKTNSDIFLN